MRLKLIQSGSQVQVRLTYSDAFGDRNFGVATIADGTASWSIRESCVARFRWAGYNYDNPGVSTFKLSFREATELVFTEETHWTSPCATNHPIETEKIERILKRQ